MNVLDSLISIIKILSKNEKVTIKSNDFKFEATVKGNFKSLFLKYAFERNFTVTGMAKISAKNSFVRFGISGKTNIEKLEKMEFIDDDNSTQLVSDESIFEELEDIFLQMKKIHASFCLGKECINTKLDPINFVLMLNFDFFLY